MTSNFFNYSYSPSPKEEILMLGAVTAITKTHPTSSPHEIKRLLAIAFPYLSTEAVNYWCQWFGINSTPRPVVETQDKCLVYNDSYRK